MWAQINIYILCLWLNIHLRLHQISLKSNFFNVLVNIITHNPSKRRQYKWTIIINKLIFYWIGSKRRVLLVTEICGRSYRNKSWEVKKQQWVGKLWMCGHLHSTKVPVLKSAPWNKSEASIGCEVIVQSLRPAPHSFTDWKAQFRLEQFLDTCCRHCNLKCPNQTYQSLRSTSRHKNTPWRAESHLGVERMIWREMLDICCFKCKIMTSPETGGFCKTGGTAFRVHKTSWRPLGGAVLIRGPPVSLIVLQQQRTSYVLQDASVSEKCHIHVVLEKSHDTESLPSARLETKADKNIRWTKYIIQRQIAA